MSGHFKLQWLNTVAEPPRWMTVGSWGTRRAIMLAGVSIPHLHYGMTTRLWDSDANEAVWVLTK